MIATARIAGIMAAKKTHELIPLCHPLALTKISVDIEPDAALPGLRVTAIAKLDGKTGVEMEALTAVSVACLTIYDMAKAVDRGMASPTSGWRRRPAGARATGRAPAAMSLLPVDEAVMQLLAGVDPARGEKCRSCRCGRARARGGRRGAADPAALPRFRHGRLRRARRRCDRPGHG